jgi:hypothetical protein
MGAVTAATMLFLASPAMKGSSMANNNPVVVFQHNGSIESTTSAQSHRSNKAFQNLSAANKTLFSLYNCTVRSR